jgi:hypothetical protein
LRVATVTLDQVAASDGPPLVLFLGVDTAGSLAHAVCALAAAWGASTMDGWDCFVAGWAGCLTAIAGTPFTADPLARFAGVATPHRPAT